MGVGGTRVGVAVGGTRVGVAVGGTGVAVAVGGTGVAVAVGGTAVGGAGVGGSGVAGVGVDVVVRHPTKKDSTNIVLIMCLSDLWQFILFSFPSSLALLERWVTTLADNYYILP